MSTTWERLFIAGNLDMRMRDNWTREHDKKGEARMPPPGLMQITSASSAKLQDQLQHEHLSLLA
jgi:hypothetical protein